MFTVKKKNNNNNKIISLWAVSIELTNYETKIRKLENHRHVYLMSQITFKPFQTFSWFTTARDKVAMLVVNTKETLLLNLHQNRVHFPAEKNAFVIDPQHGRRDVTCKPATSVNLNGCVLEMTTVSNSFCLPFLS